MNYKFKIGDKVLTKVNLGNKLPVGTLGMIQGTLLNFSTANFPKDTVTYRVLFSGFPISFVFSEETLTLVSDPIEVFRDIITK